jgi:hypothetical protein
MNLSNLFGGTGPAQTTLISGGVTDSIITSSPAILLGYMAGSIATGAVAGGGTAQYQFTIKNGTTIIINGVSAVTYSTQGINNISSGINCPSGITVTTAKRFSDDPALDLTNARFTVFYVLK